MWTQSKITLLFWMWPIIQCNGLDNTLKINICHKYWEKLIKSHNCSEHSSSVVKEPSLPRDTKAILVPFQAITCPSQVTCTTLLHHSLSIRVCGVSSEPHDQYQIFDRSSLELLLDMLEWKFCCYLSLAEYDDLVAFVLLFRFLLIRIVILNAFLIQPLPIHEMKISQWCLGANATQMSLIHKVSSIHVL